MEKNAETDSELSDAEAALKKAELKHGNDHIAVSYCLDNVVRILRSRGIRALDAANMDARARAIRINCNNDSAGDAYRKMVDISEAIAVATKRQRAERQRRTIVRLLSVVVIGLVVGKLTLAPSRAEREFVGGAIKNVHSVLPTSYVQNVLGQGKVAVESAKAANDLHNKQLESFMGE